MNSLVKFINSEAVSGKANVILRKEVRSKKDGLFIEKETRYIGITIGQSYLIKVLEAQTASDSKPNYVTDKSWHKVVDKFFNQHKTKGTLYLRGIIANNESHPGISTVWYCNGKLVDYSVVEPYLYAADKLKPHKDIKKQIESGIDADKQVDYVLISVDNITTFEQNDKVWLKLR